MDLEATRKLYPGAECFTFGDRPELGRRLPDLVRAGRKTATCGALGDFQAGEAVPVRGRRDIALDREGRPALVIEAPAVTRMRYRNLDGEIALAEGENESLAGWRKDHRAYFERNGGFDPERELLCERFRLVAEIAGAGDRGSGRG